MPKKTTIRDVACKAGVSPSTVSRVLNGHSSFHMKPETRDRVLEVIKELRYTPARTAQRMRRQRRDIIGVLLPDISNPYFSLLARGVESIAFEKGYSTLICDSNHSEDRESLYLDLLGAEQVDGIILVPVARPDWSRITLLRDQGVKIVAADRCPEGLLGVEAANWRGSYDLTKYVLSLGFQRIAYIAGPENVRTSQDRVRGFRDAMKKVSLEPVTIRYGEYRHDSGLRIATEILNNTSVEVLMAGDDLVALGAIRAAESLGLDIPRDLGVTGFDSVPLLSLMYPTLTSVRIPVFDIGCEAMSMLVRHIGSPEPDEHGKVLDVEIVTGSSCLLNPSTDQQRKSPLLEVQKHEGGG